MKIGIKRAGVATAAIAAFAFASPAYSQATRTWVSGVGDDVNPCSRTAPCKTFAGAISKTAAGGEINCLDPGGYGTLTITKSITVDCTGTFGSSLNSGGINGFVVNDSLSLTPGTAEVILRGISINGAGSTPGLNGVRFISGRSLVLEDVFIQNQRSGSGISLAPTTAMRFSAENVTIANGGVGMTLQPSATGSIKATARNLRITNAVGNGIRIDNSVSATGVFLTLDSAVITRADNGLSLVSAGAGFPVRVMLTNSTIANNATNGILAGGAGTQVRVGNTSIHANLTGLTFGTGAVVNTYGTNRLDGNTPDGAFTAPAIPQE